MCACACACARKYLMAECSLQHILSLLSCPAASQCEPGCVSLPSAGRGGSLDENLGSPETESAGHQLCGHTVRSVTDGNTFIVVFISRSIIYPAFEP